MKQRLKYGHKATENGPRESSLNFCGFASLSAKNSRVFHALDLTTFDAMYIRTCTVDFEYGALSGRAMLQNHGKQSSGDNFNFRALMHVFY